MGPPDRSPLQTQNLLLGMTEAHVTIEALSEGSDLGSFAGAVVSQDKGAPI